MRAVKQTLLIWLGIAGVWTAIGLLFAVQLYLTRAEIEAPVSWRFALEKNLSDWYIFALLSLPTMALARRFRFERAHWAKSLSIHLVASGVFAMPAATADHWIFQSTASKGPDRRTGTVKPVSAARSAPSWPAAVEVTVARAV